jgi:predicted amidohydrolase YtcJ
MMKKASFALSVLIASAASPNSLIDHANGIEADRAGHVEHFDGMLISNQGKVIRLLHTGEPRPKAEARIDAHGATIMPGFIDAHGHIMDLGFVALRLDVTGAGSLGELQKRLRDYASAHPRDPWIIGFGWNQELWPDKKFPTAADIDAVVSDRPVVLERVDGHALIVNSAAMKAAGITGRTKAPTGGSIENGLFVDSARKLIDDAEPEPTKQQMDAAFAKAQSILLGFGVTGVGSMSTSLDDWSTFKRAGDAGKLQIRLMVYLLDDPTQMKAALDPLKRVSRPTPWLYGDRLRAVGVKLFADGALGSRGAWLKEPYRDAPNQRGNRLHSDTELRDIEDKAASRGFQIATHAIGDAANAQVISSYEWLNSKYGLNRRWRIEHAQIIDCGDLPRIARGAMIASMQPTHQTSDRLMAEKRLGPARLKCAYAWRSVLKSGAKLAFGTDFPVESPNPFPGLSAAVSREDMNDEPPGGWFPEERISLGEALRAYTRGGAYAGFAEDRIGALEPGKWADFILVDADPTKADPQQLARLKVLQTWVAGKKVWSRTSSASASRHGR